MYCAVRVAASVSVVVWSCEGNVGTRLPTAATSIRMSRRDEDVDAAWYGGTVVVQCSGRVKKSRHASYAFNLFL